MTGLVLTDLDSTDLEVGDSPAGDRLPIPGDVAAQAAQCTLTLSFI